MAEIAARALMVEDRGGGRGCRERSVKRREESIRKEEEVKLSGCYELSAS
jgi:hypothetical protein